jgi:hypothetical protein
VNAMVLNESVRDAGPNLHPTGTKCHTRFLEDKPNANHLRARIRNSRRQ